MKVRLMSLLEQRMTLRNLRLIDAIAREGSLLRAAQGMNMTQSAITKALQELEATAGVRLFERSNRGALPTPFGEAMIAHARVILTQIQHADQELADLRDGSGGKVAIGTLLSAAVELLPAAIAQVLQSRPNLTIRIVEGTNDSLMPQLRQGALDLIVGRLPVFRQRDGIRQEALMADDARIVARKGHPLMRKRNLSLAQLLDCHWILPRQETTLRRQIDDAFRAEGLRPPLCAVESISVLTNRALLMGTDYLAIWPVRLAESEARRGLLSILPVRLPATMGQIGISTRMTGRLSPAAQVVIAALRDQAAAESLRNSRSSAQANRAV